MDSLEWFKNNSQFLSYNKIEKHLGMPQSTLKQWTSGKRDLPKKWQPILIKWIEEFKK